MNLALSSYTHLLKVDEATYALLNALWLRVVFLQEPYVSVMQESLKHGQLPQATPNDIEEKTWELFKDLLKKEMFLDPVEDIIHLQKVREEMEQEHISIMYLILSNNCNLRCEYCYLHELLTPKVQNAPMYMSVETMNKAIDYFADLVNGVIAHPQIVLYGGEPTLNPNMEYLIKLVYEKILGVNISLVTNGTLITKDLAEILAKYHINVGVSIDGPQKIHDTNRKFHNGRGSFEEALKGYKTLLEKGALAGISCTITMQNAPTLVDTMHWLLDEQGVLGIDFNLLIDEESSEYPEIATKGLMECYELAKQRGLPLERVLRRVQPFSEGRLNLHDCGGTGNQIVITTDGRVGICQGFLNSGDFFFPLEEIKDPNTHPLWAEWRKRSPINIDGCHSCPAFGICGGGCFYGPYTRHGSIMKLDPVHCTHVLATLDVILKDLWKKQRG